MGGNDVPLGPPLEESIEGNQNPTPSEYGTKSGLGGNRFTTGIERSGTLVRLLGPDRKESPSVGGKRSNAVLVLGYAEDRISRLPIVGVRSMPSEPMDPGMVVSPHHDGHLADDVRRGDGPPDTAVRGITPAIAHHEVLPGWDRGCGDVRRRLAAYSCLLREPGLSERSPIDQNRVPRRRDRLTGETDHPFDQVRIFGVVITRCASEDHDVSSMDGRRKLVHDEVIADLQGGEHRTRRHDEGLCGIRPNTGGDDQYGRERGEQYQSAANPRSTPHSCAH